jgi:hypothetical protein
MCNPRRLGLGMPLRVLLLGAAVVIAVGGFASVAAPAAAVHGCWGLDISGQCCDIQVTFRSWLLVSRSVR